MQGYFFNSKLCFQSYTHLPEREADFIEGWSNLTKLIYQYEGSYTIDECELVQNKWN